MAAPRMTQDDVGAFYAGEDGTVWKLIGYASEPTATLERIYPVTGSEAILGHRVRRDGVVGAPIFEGFTRMVLDGGVAEQVARCVYPGCPAPTETLIEVGYLSPKPDVQKRVLACRDHLEWVRNEAGENISFNSGFGREHV